MVKFLFILAFVTFYSCNNIDKNDAYLIKNNEAYLTNISIVVDRIKLNTNNEYYLEKAYNYHENLRRITDLINKDDYKKAALAIKTFVEKEQISIGILKDFDFLKGDLQINRDLMINRLLCIEYSLVNNLYTMNIQSNFELNEIKLVALDGSIKDGIYQADLAIIAINSEKKYTVVIDNDTIKEYVDDFPIFKDRNPKKGVHTLPASVIINRWGQTIKLPFELTYEVK